MSEMQERVAKAIGAVLSKDSTGACLLCSTHEQDIELARAALDAMWEPTDRMCNSGAAKWDHDFCTETNALNMWQAMVDEALK